MATFVTRADEVEAASLEAATAIDEYATALETVQAGLALVRQRAVTAGLRTTPDAIVEPGLAPSVPSSPATDGTASAAQVTAYNRAIAAHNAHADKVTAYNSAVDETTTLVTVFEGAVDALAGVAQKAVLSWTSWVEGAVIATEATFARYVSSARDYAESLRQSAQWAEEAYLRSPGGSPEAQLQERLRTNAANQADELTRHADDLSAGRLARLFGGKLPVVGTIVTVAGIGYDVSTGTAPSSAIVGGLAGAAATMATVALVSGPVGWVAAAGVIAGVAAGMGAQWMWENWVPADVRQKIDDGIKDVWDATTNAVSDGWKSVTGGVTDAWEAIF